MIIGGSMLYVYAKNTESNERVKDVTLDPKSVERGAVVFEVKE